MTFLLDTNIVSQAIRYPASPAAFRILAAPPGELITSIIVAAEARFGLRKDDSKRLTARLEEFFERVPVLPFEAPAELRYAELRVALEKRGTPIGANDMLIAAHALALECTLVTANERGFRRVPGLKVENWLEG